jgi:hypothetical protein
VCIRSILIGCCHREGPVAPGCIVCNTAEAPASGMKSGLPAATGLHECASMCSTSLHVVQKSDTHLKTFCHVVRRCCMFAKQCVFLPPNTGRYRLKLVL